MSHLEAYPTSPSRASCTGSAPCGCARPPSRAAGSSCSRRRGCSGASSSGGCSVRSLAVPARDPPLRRDGGRRPPLARALPPALLRAARARRGAARGARGCGPRLSRRPRAGRARSARGALCRARSIFDVFCALDPFPRAAAARTPTTNSEASRRARSADRSTTARGWHALTRPFAGRAGAADGRVGAARRHIRAARARGGVRAPRLRPAVRARARPVQRAAR